MVTGALWYPEQMNGKQVLIWAFVIVVLIFIATDAATANQVVDGLFSTAARLIHDVYSLFNKGH